MLSFLNNVCKGRMYDGANYTPHGGSMLYLLSPLQGCTVQLVYSFQRLFEVGLVALVGIISENPGTSRHCRCRHLREVYNSRAKSLDSKFARPSVEGPWRVRPYASLVNHPLYSLPRGPGVPKYKGQIR